MNMVDADRLRYAGFWPRLGALLLDALILLPLSLLAVWGSNHYRWFYLYSLVPSSVLGLFYSVYLVGRWGGTPGKLLVGIRIRKLNGEPVGYGRAFLRHLPDFVLGLLMSLALILAVSHMTDAEYYTASSLERARRIRECAPSWLGPFEVVQGLWIWGELVVLLTNRKRRALHDFLAGTVVVHEAGSPR